MNSSLCDFDFVLDDATYATVVDLIDFGRINKDMSACDQGDVIYWLEELEKPFIEIFGAKAIRAAWKRYSREVEYLKSKEDSKKPVLKEESKYDEKPAPKKESRHDEPRVVGYWPISNSHNDCLFEALAAYMYLSNGESDYTRKLSEILDNYYGYKATNENQNKEHRILRKVCKTAYRDIFSLSGIDNEGIHKYAAEFKEIYVGFVSPVRVDVYERNSPMYADVLGYKYTKTEYADQLVYNPNYLYVQLVNEGNYHYVCLVHFNNTTYRIDSCGSTISIVDRATCNHTVILSCEYRGKDETGYVMSRLMDHFGL